MACDTLRPGDALGKFVAIVGGYTYPTLSDPASQAIWINRFASLTNGSPSVDGNAVDTVVLDPAWGYSVFGNILQPSAADRPTWKTDGFQGNGTSTVLPLSNTLALAGDFTIYYVMNSGGAGRDCVPLGADGSLSFQIMGNTQSNFYVINDATTVMSFAEPTAYTIVRIRRTGINIFFKASGNAESPDSIGGTFTFKSVLARTGGGPAFMNTSSRIGQIVVYRKCVTPGDADDLAVLAKLRSLESGVIGP